MTGSATTTPLPLAADFPVADLAVWRQLIDKALKGADFDRRLVAETADGLRIAPLYTARPTSGARVSVSHGWDIRQIHAEADPATANSAILEDLAGGATSVELQFATPGMSGLPKGRPHLERALAGVLLDVCPVALKAGDGTPDAAADLMALWASAGIDPKQRKGAFNFDPLGVLAQNGYLSTSVDAALASAAQLIKHVHDCPNVTALRADGHVWHRAGSSEGQELAAVLSTVVAYLRAAEAMGLAPSQALSKIVINLAVDADQLMGLAKLRAARQLVGRIAEACGATSAKVMVTAETSVAMMSRRDPWVNMLRTTMACATAAWGGADVITVLPYTWALGQPDAFARRMARNTSIVLMEESGLGRVSDPAAGSFAVETLTADLAGAAWSLFQGIEARGGLINALRDGSLQNQISTTAQAKRKAIATGKQQLTGTSAFPRLGDEGVTVTPWPVSSGVKTGSGFGGVNITALTPFRAAAAFEQLRDRADAYAARVGGAPRVFLVCLGPLASHAARSTWIANFLAAGGIGASQSAPILQSADAGAAFRASGAAIACLCGADDTYGELGEATATLLKTAGAKRVLLAGRPKAHEAALKAAGVDDVIYAGCDMIETLANLQHALGIADIGA